MPMHKLLVILVIAFILPSCTHLHVPADAKLANQLKEDFSKATANDSNIYSAMLKNMEQMGAKEQLRLESRKKERSADIANGLYTQKWEEIREELKTLKKGINEDVKDKTMAEHLVAIKKRLSAMTGKINSSKGTLKEARALLIKTRKEQNKWNARHELFRQSIKSFAEINVDEETDENFDVRTAVRGAKSKILETLITVVVVDEKGKEEKEEEKKIGSILMNIDKDPFLKLVEANSGNLYNEDYEPGINFLNLIKANSGSLFNEDFAPGIKIVIFGLAMDLAEKELKRNKLDKEYLKKVVSLLEKLKKQNNTILLINEAVNSITRRIDAKLFKADDTVLKTINTLRKNDKADDLVYSAFFAIGIYSRVKVDSDHKLFRNLQLAMLDHEYSIKLSAINAQEHEILISRGLQGLAAYHEGGITPEAIANFIRAAQAAALGVIGAGVL